MNLQNDFGIDGSQSLESLEGPMLHYDIPTSLMERIRTLATTPLSSIDDEGLRLLLVQRMFSKSVVPAAIIILNREPFAGGNLEQGSVMRSLFQFTSAEFWQENKNLFCRAQMVLSAAKIKLSNELVLEKDPENRSLLLEAEDNFDKADQHCQAIECKMDKK